jgi:PAS domain S-box-containing protein
VISRSIAELDVEIWGRQSLPVQTRQAIMGSLPIVVYTTDLEDRIRFVNRPPGNLTMEEVLGRDFFDFVAPDDQVVARECREIVRQTGEPMSYIASPSENQDGEWYDVWVAPLVVDNEMIGLSAIVTDITDFKQISTAYAVAEESRAQQERLFRVLIEQNSELISIVDQRGNFIYFSPVHEKVLGFSKDYLWEQGVLRLIHQDDRRIAWKNLNEARNNPGSDVRIPMIRLRCHDGRWLMFEVIIKDLQHVDGINGIVISARDITERHRAEKDVRNFKTIADRANYGTLITDMDGIIIYVNEAMANMHDLSVDEIVGWGQSVFHTTSQYMQLTEVTQEILRDGLIVSREIWHAKKDGTEFPSLMSGSVVADDEGEPMFISTTYIDISELKKKEEEIRQFNVTLEDRVEKRTRALKETQAQLVESEKMASLGGLVAGVAHEINTPVGVGVTAASHLGEQTQRINRLFDSGQMKKSDLMEYLELCAEASKLLSINLERAAGLIQSFKKVAIDQSTDDIRCTNLESCLKTTLESLHPSTRRVISEATVDCPGDIELMVNPGDISQILTNLVMNSMAHGFSGRNNGRITVEVVYEGEALVWYYRDDGSGMTAEVMSKIFEPFFTTRPSMDNSGLGMHIVYNIVTQKLGGSLSCSSEEGQGVEFRIQLPLSDQ